jgi:dipeptidyl aminopeptidase/acylaminoacyl peptidase
MSLSTHLWALAALLAAWIPHSLPAAPASETPIPPSFTHEDLWLLKQVGSPSPSPNGQWVILPVTETAYDSKNETTDLWLVPADASSPPRRFTTARSRESAPAWSPDSSRIAFIAQREGDETPQLYLIHLQGGEAQRLTQWPVAVRTPVWSPDGQSLLFQASVPRGATNETSLRQLVEERKNAKSKVRAYDSFATRRWDQWLDDRQTRLFLIPADGSLPPRDLIAPTRFADHPGFRGASSEGASDSLQPCWSPDGRSILFTATTQADTTAFSQPVLSLYQLFPDSTRIQRLTPLEYQASQPAFTPDGQHLVFLANRGVERTYYALQRLVAAPWPWNGKIRELAPDFDRSVSGFDLSPDSQTAYFTADDAGHVRVWSAPLTGGEATLFLPTPTGTWSSLNIPPQANPPVLFSLWEAAHRPAELFRVDLDSGHSTRLTTFNVDIADRLNLPPVESFWFTNRVGLPVHSLLIRPPGFDASRRYPLLHLIHGGHASMWRDAFIRRWNYHLLAQPGYVVLLTDYTGSIGYGEAFTRAIQGDPLRGPSEDLLAAAETAVQRFPFIDPARQAAAGASYGGHLVNWLQAATTHFRCFISHAGLTSLYAQWSNSDAIFHRELMMDAPPWENPSAWIEHSPATYADRFQTPMLLSIGESDFRVPLNNVLELWTLLQRRQVPSRLLVWPDENHWIQKGENSRRFYQEVHAWLDRWLKP